MSLAVYLSNTRNLAATSQGPLRLALEDDGVFWCLWEFVGRLPSLTGHPIDLYSDAVFDSSLLPALSDALARARSQYQHGSATLSVKVGVQVAPMRRDLYDEISRRDLLTTIAALQSLAAEALKSQQYLVFIGD